MDFFQNQEVARKKTGLLIVYFLLAVILIIVTVYVAIAAVLHLGGSGGAGRRGWIAVLRSGTRSSSGPWPWEPRL